MSEEIYKGVVEIIGKRADDPDVLAFLARHGLGEPPICMKLDLRCPLEHPSDGWALDFECDIGLPAFQPPRREGGQYVAYVTGATFKAGFTGSVAGNSMNLTRAEVAGRAIATDLTPMVEIFTLERHDDWAVRFWFDADDASFWDAGVYLIPQPDDADVLAARAKAPKVLPRAMPRDVGAGAKERMPAALAKLAELQPDEGLGELDLEIYDDFQSGGPAAWTGNAKAEQYFRVFGGDGTGGLLAFWMVHEGKPLAEQPVVF